MESGRKWWLPVVFLPAMAACRGPTPGTLVGESEHFRLFVDPASTEQYSDPETRLAALEADWADKATMLHTPEGKISYYLLTPADVEQACSISEFGGSELACTWPDSLEVDASSLPQQHELMHAYMAMLSSARRPIALIAEGAAQSLGCATGQGTPFSENPPWQELALEAATDSTEVYDEGGLLARYLIRTQGIDAFVDYYRQAPEVGDPAVFAANFQAFWGTTIDEDWAAMHVPPAGSVGMDQTICPCSLPALIPDGQPTGFDSQGANRYWTLPATAGQAIALNSPGGSYQVTLEDCAGVAPTILGPAGDPLVVDLQSSSGAYVLQVATASLGQYLADECASTTPYQVPANVLSSAGSVELVASRPSPATVTQYAQVQVPAAAQLELNGLQEVCDTCNFDQGNCQPLPGRGATVPVRGTFYLRTRFLPLQAYDPNPNVVLGGFSFAN